MADIFTSAGEAKVVDLLDAATWYVAQGTGTTGAAKGDTTLETESAESRVSTTDTQPAADTFQMVGSITSSSTQAITEAGIFDASSSGNLLLRSTFSAINVTNGDSIQFTFQLQFA